MGEDGLDGVVQARVAAVLGGGDGSGLEDEDASGREGVLDLLVVLAREESETRPVLDRIGEVGDDEVPVVVGFVEGVERITDDEIGARIVERALVHLGQMLDAGVHDLAVDVHHAHGLDGLPAQEFAHGGAFTPAEDERALRGAVQDGPDVDEGFVVEELVSGARLPEAVEDEGLAIDGALDDLHVLEVGASRGEHARHAMHVQVTRREGLGDPDRTVHQDTRASRASLTVGMPDSSSSIARSSMMSLCRAAGGRPPWGGPPPPPRGPRT